jgi:hypothetical protein
MPSQIPTSPMPSQIPTSPMPSPIPTPSASSYVPVSPPALDSSQQQQTYSPPDSSPFLLQPTQQQINSPPPSTLIPTREFISRSPGNPKYRVYENKVIGCPIGTAPIKNRLSDNRDDGAAVFECDNKDRTNGKDCAGVVWHKDFDNQAYALGCDCSSGPTNSIVPAPDGWNSIVYVKQGIGSCFDGQN